MTRALLCAAFLAAAGLCQAQTKVEPTPLGRLLEAARDRGLFGRVEGTRHFRLGGGDELVLIQIDVRRDGEETWIQSTVNHLDPTRPTLRAVNLHLGPVGQIVKLRLILRTPEKEVTATGRVLEGEIEFEFKDGPSVDVQRFPWSERTIPGMLALFVLPCFPELLPRDGWDFVQFDEQGLASGPRTIRAQRDEDGTRVELTHTDSGAVQLEARLNLNGRLVSLLRGEERIVLVTAREAQRLTEEARTRRPAPEPEDAPPPEGEQPDAPQPPR
ncbi:MAG: hypothetical protein R3F62_18820 [Planctomycetota bacterium]